MGIECETGKAFILKLTAQSTTLHYFERLVNHLVRNFTLFNMPFGVLEVHNEGQHVPGTALLEAEEALQGHRFTLKRASGKDTDVILIPQPSNDPNDPLNWPLWQRDLILLLYCYCTLCTIGG